MERSLGGLESGGGHDSDTQSQSNIAVAGSRSSSPARGKRKAADDDEEDGQEGITMKTIHAQVAMLLKGQADIRSKMQ